MWGYFFELVLYLSTLFCIAAVTLLCAAVYCARFTSADYEVSNAIAFLETLELVY